MAEQYVSDAVKYVGVDDKGIDLFESQYRVPNGVSYNSYIILDQKIAIMDTVDKRATEAWLANVEQVLEGKVPDYLIISHMEPDHAANIQTIAEKYPTMQLVGNGKTLQMLSQFFSFSLEGRTITVKEGDELSLGEHTLVFYMAPMVHWPEVMVEYEKKEQILFSADGFGKFGALDAEEEWTAEARRYYINIVGKYGAQVQALLKKASGLAISKICPLHGPILTENLGYYLEKYDRWSSYRPEEKGILIAYASIHGNTKKAAEEMGELFKQAGVEQVKVTDLSRSDLAEAVADAFCYDRMLLACATYDGGLFPVMEDFLQHLKNKNYQKRKVGLMENGSWAPLAAKKMKEYLEQMKDIELCTPVVTIKSAVKEDTLEGMRQLVSVLKD
ncbi:MAG: FprA family A-type flavoprotein [Lachnospiraceae bacterium]|nr:FprA family A-type flavoprotein [Lachnospiraceae bacterium]